MLAYYEQNVILHYGGIYLKCKGLGDITISNINEKLLFPTGWQKFHHFFYVFF